MCFDGESGFGVPFISTVVLVSAAVTLVRSLNVTALDYIRIQQSCCVCQVELVMMSQSVRIVPLVDHIFLLIIMHTYYITILLYVFIVLYVDTL